MKGRLLIALLTCSGVTLHLPSGLERKSAS
jgi:hypothetical protein